MKRLLFALLSVLLITGCATSATPSGRRVTIEMKDYEFSPKQVEVKAGEPITWVLQNKGPHLHEFASPEAGQKEVEVPAGQTKEVAWTAPKQPGNYTFICPVHESLGMKMTVTVK